MKLSHFATACFALLGFVLSTISSAQAQYVGSGYSRGALEPVGAGAPSVSQPLAVTRSNQDLNSSGSLSTKGLFDFRGAGGGVMSTGRGTTVGGSAAVSVAGIPIAGGISNKGGWLSIGGVGGAGLGNEIIDDRACRVLALAEGSFGALVMVVAGLIAVVSAAMGGYKTALSCLVVGVGSWILYPIVTLFFGDLFCGWFF